MANHKSAKKSIRQIKKKTTVNRSRLSRIRTFIRSVEEAIKINDKQLASTKLREVQSELMIGVKNSVLKLNAASRKISRLSARIKAIA